MKASSVPPVCPHLAFLSRPSTGARYLEPTRGDSGAAFCNSAYCYRTDDLEIVQSGQESEIPTIGLGVSSLPSSHSPCLTRLDDTSAPYQCRLPRTSQAVQSLLRNMSSLYPPLRNRGPTAAFSPLVGASGTPRTFGSVTTCVFSSSFETWTFRYLTIQPFHALDHILRLAIMSFLSPVIPALASTTWRITQHSS